MNPSKSPEERELTGNPSHRPIPEPLAVIEGHSGGVPEAPDDLGPVGLATWGRIWPVLVAWARPDLDLNLARRYCQALDEREDLRVKANRKTRTAWRDRVSLQKLEDRLLVMERDLGLNPAGRKSLGIRQEKPKPVRKLDAYVNRADAVRPSGV